MVDVSAMTVLHGGPEVEAARRSVLGADPLRSDADPEALRARVKQSKPSIGFLLMDQAFFSGVGNIYRAEILAASRVHPDTPAAAVSDAALDRHHHHMLPPATSARTAARHRTSTKSPPPSYSRCTAITLPSRGAHATVRRRPLLGTSASMPSLASAAAPRETGATMAISTSAGPDAGPVPGSGTQ